MSDDKPYIKMTLDQRQLAEIRLCLYYNEYCNHGADGHNRMNLLAMLAKGHGFRLAKDKSTLLFLPDTSVVVGASGDVVQLDPEEVQEWLAVEQESLESQIPKS